MKSDDNESGFYDDAPELAAPGYDVVAEVYKSATGPSVVLKAKHHGKWVAIKAIKPELRGNPVYEAMLKKEFEIGYALSHPRLAQTLDYAEIPQWGRCIVMEWVKGETLRSLIDRRGLNLAQAEAIARQLIEAVGYLRAKQVTHRDLKPENIIVTASGNDVKIIDFGLADAPEYHILKQPAGTPRYIPRDTADGDDIYALGIIAGELNRSLSRPSRALISIERQCSRPDAAKRPASPADIRWPKPRRWLHAAIIIAAIAVAAIIYYYSRAVGEERQAAVAEEVAPTPADTLIPVAPEPIAESVPVTTRHPLLPDFEAAIEALDSLKTVNLSKTEARKEVMNHIYSLCARGNDAAYAEASALRQSKGEPLEGTEVQEIIQRHTSLASAELERYCADNPDLLALAGITPDLAQEFLIVYWSKGDDHTRWAALYQP